MFYSFLWSGRGEDKIIIKRDEMISDYKNGGFGGDAIFKGSLDKRFGKDYAYIGRLYN